MVQSALSIYTKDRLASQQNRFSLRGENVCSISVVCNPLKIQTITLSSYNERYAVSCKYSLNSFGDLYLAELPAVHSVRLQIPFPPILFNTPENNVHWYESFLVLFIDIFLDLLGGIHGNRSVLVRKRGQKI